MGISLNFINEGATVKHLNIRKQGPSDDKILAVDIKLSGTVVIGDWTRELFSPFEDDASFMPDLLKTFYLDDDEKNLRVAGIRSFKSARQFRQCTLEYGGMTLNGDASKFSVDLLAGQIAELEFSFSVIEPGAKTVSILAEMVGEYSGCQLFGADLFDQGDD